MLQIVRHHVRGVGDVEDDAVKAGGFDVLGDFLDDFDGLAQRVHAGLALAHVGQRAGRHDQQLGIGGIAVIPGVNFSAAGQVVRGIEQIQRLRFCLFAVHVDVNDFFGQRLREQRVPGVGADVPGPDDDDFAFLHFHNVYPSQCVFFFTICPPVNSRIQTNRTSTTTVTLVMSTMLRSWP